jgi:hypothetical protein
MMNAHAQVCTALHAHMVRVYEMMIIQWQQDFSSLFLEECKISGFQA